MRWPGQDQFNIMDTGLVKTITAEDVHEALKTGIIVIEKDTALYRAKNS